jgi:preprotein translocase subunit SecF
MPGEIAESIPFTAWEQAVFVVLVIVLVITLVAIWNREANASRVFQAEQSREWQEFISGQDDKWRTFSKEQREANNTEMRSVSQSLRDLAQVTSGLAREVQEMRQESRVHADRSDLHNDELAKLIGQMLQAKPTRSRKVSD